MSKDPEIDPDEAALFHREVEDVKRLKHDKVTHARLRPPCVPKHLTQQNHANHASVEQDFLSDEYDACDVEIDDELRFIRPGVQKTVLRKLRRGQLLIGAELDLHGHIQTTARSTLSAFLRACVERDIRCIKIIHGKGYGSRQGRPVLKGKVNSWLRQRDEVLAFCSARREDGGTGAVYVLLKHIGKQGR
ncbi:MAG TPA: DNA mismatch repair protein MutS [Candidatus Tenderia sp.]|nr:DNA mismatch repair protein MutS [Candidatus Tenderia sp.]